MVMIGNTKSEQSENFDENTFLVPYPTLYSVEMGNLPCNWGIFRGKLKIQKLTHKFGKFVRPFKL